VAQDRRDHPPLWRRREHPRHLLRRPGRLSCYRFLYLIKPRPLGGDGVLRSPRSADINGASSRRALGITGHDSNRKVPQLSHASQPLRATASTPLGRRPAVARDSGGGSWPFGHPVALSLLAFDRRCVDHTPPARTAGRRAARGSGLRSCLRPAPARPRPRATFDAPG